MKWRGPDLPGAIKVLLIAAAVATVVRWYGLTQL
jgi:hypothetical protein